jgi:anti-sigma regulatory factor (Ser/Thr protein kinase)
MVTVSPFKPWSYALQLPHDPRAARIARHTLRAVLDSHRLPQLVDTAELLACELVTNAYRYAPGSAQLTVGGMGHGRLRVGVRDNNPYIPAPFDGVSDEGRCRPAPASASVVDDGDGGRGLLLVRLCADGWGGESVRGGKVLWFELVARVGLRQV